jgi:hypothetical protein
MGSFDANCRARGKRLIMKLENDCRAEKRFEGGACRADEDIEE